MKGIKNSYYLISFLILFLGSCQDKTGVSFVEFYDFESEGLIPNKEYIFHPFQDTLYLNTDKVDIFLAVRYNEDCKIESLPLFLEYASLESDSIKNQSINIQLFEEREEFPKKHKMGIYEKEITLLKDQKREEGFFLSLSTPEKNTRGINSVGIICKNKI